MSRKALQLIKLPEPKLLFAHGQAVEDPRDGLTLFGPLDEGRLFGIRPAVVGTSAGIERFARWATTIHRTIDDKKMSRPTFPGFEAAFGIPFGSNLLECVVNEAELTDACNVEDVYQRVHRVVRLYAQHILSSTTDEEAKPDVWFVVVPDLVYERCRPKSIVPKGLRVETNTKLSAGIAKRLLSTPSMFEDLNTDAEPYQFQPHFRNQLKAVLLASQAPTQIVRESTIAPYDFLNQFGYPRRRVGAASEIAWNLSSTAFYKAGARPWKVADVRPGVCYLGVVFKRDDAMNDSRWSSCGAQMFLDSGDGLVFKGTGGPWYSESLNDFHLDETAARALIERAVKTYKDKVGEPPRELFIHGKARFNDDEWRGFRSAVTSATNVVGVRIRHANDLRIYRPERFALLRGLAYQRDQRTAFLWAQGFIPRLWTYPGREVPLGLLIDVCRGDADMMTVLKDVLALTKLNYNSCTFGDGQPVTLKFADAVGEILTAGPVSGAPLPFRLYI
jgi:hypothetical protein